MPYLYTHAVLDTYHRERLVIPNSPFPTVAKLLQLQEELGGAVLLTVAETAQRLGLSNTAIADHVRRGNIVAVRLLDKHLRIAVPSLAAYQLERAARDLYDVQEIAKITGLCDETVLDMTTGAHPLLPRAYDVPRGKKVRVANSTLIAYLDEHLATGTAQDWLAMQAMSGFGPLVTEYVAERTYHIPPADIKAEIENGGLPCLYTPSTIKPQSRIPLHAVQRWLARRRLLTAAEIVSVLNPPATEIATPSDRRRFCTLHKSSARAKCPGLVCIIDYVNAHRTTDVFDGEEWVAWAQQDKAQPMRANELVELVPGVNEAEIVADAASGVLRAVRLPSGRYVIARSDAVAYARRARRLLEGSDYHSL